MLAYLHETKNPNLWTMILDFMIAEYLNLKLNGLKYK